MLITCNWHSDLHIDMYALRKFIDLRRCNWLNDTLLWIEHFRNMPQKRIRLSIWCKITFDFIQALLCLLNVHTPTYWGGRMFLLFPCRHERLCNYFSTLLYGFIITTIHWYSVDRYLFLHFWINAFVIHIETNKADISMPFPHSSPVYKRNICRWKYAFILTL